MNKINQYNQWLLERYPNVWNSRITWMLAISFIIHIVFFILGYLSHMDPKSLQDYRAINDYYSSGLIALHLIISILLLVGWAITLFKNNAFKSFYPITKASLFSQFLQYFIIILAATTFYFSFMLGYKSYISKTYNDEKIKKTINLANTTSAFLPYNLDVYGLKNRLSPKIFEELYVETDATNIDPTKPFVVNYDHVYQYYTKVLVVVKEKNKKGDYIFPEAESKKYSSLAYSELREDGMHYYFKDKIVDVKPLLNSTKPNFRNYSSVLYFKSDYPIYYRTNDYQKQEDLGFQDDYLKDRIKVNRSVNAILDDKNPEALKKLLTEFLAMSKEHKIETNINVEDWLKQINKTKNHDVGFFILTHRNENVDRVAKSVMLTDEVYAVSESNEATTSSRDFLKQFNPNINQEVSPNKFYEANVTNLFYAKKDLENLIINVEEIKEKQILDDLIHFYIWIAFGLASVVFSFRVAGLRPLLFSMISAGVLSIAISLVSVVTTMSNHIEPKFFVFYLCFFIGLGIILLSIFGNKKSKNPPATIAMVITINIIAGFIFLIFGLITMHQEDMCPGKVGCNTIMDVLGTNVSFVVLALALIFLYFYTGIIQKWKSLPE